MFKKEYMEILYRIEDITGRTEKFDYDRVLDGTYNFNVNEVAIVYDLLHVIEGITVANNSLICIEDEDSITKELKFCYNRVIYKVTRIYNNDESTFITRIPNESNYYVPEKDLIKKIEEKCEIKMKLFGSYYGGIINEDSAG